MCGSGFLARAVRDFSRLWTFLSLETQNFARPYNTVARGSSPARNFCQPWLPCGLSPDHPPQLSEKLSRKSDPSQAGVLLSSGLALGNGGTREPREPAPCCRRPLENRGRFARRARRRCRRRVRRRQLQQLAHGGAAGEPVLCARQLFTDMESRNRCNDVGDGPSQGLVSQWCKRSTPPAAR